MAPAASLDNLSNPLVTSAQLETSSSSLDAIPADLETSIRYAAVRLTQAAGVLLQLPQDVIAKAIVIFTRFWVGPEGGSLAVHSAKDASAASLYLVAKLSFTPISPRSVINVYAFLLSPEASPLDFINRQNSSGKPIPETYYVSEGSYQAARLALMNMEATVLRTLAFNTHVTLPHTIALTYLQTLGTSSAALSRRVFEHLNAALLSPQLLYSTHQPNALAVSAIYLAAREEGVKLVDDEWWEVFDVDREELGFLVVGMRSMEGFAKAEKDKWKGRPVPLTIDQLEAELETRRMLEEGE
ncbi:cyclin [Histoplasma ohiense]|nr:cyclin [Histoplasma ohiense (nom. inval.)]